MNLKSKLNELLFILNESTLKNKETRALWDYEVWSDEGEKNGRHIASICKGDILSDDSDHVCVLRVENKVSERTSLFLAGWVAITSPLKMYRLLAKMARLETLVRELLVEQGDAVVVGSHGESLARGQWHVKEIRALLAHDLDGP